MSQQWPGQKVTAPAQPAPQQRQAAPQGGPTLRRVLSVPDPRADADDARADAALDLQIAKFNRDVAREDAQPKLTPAQQAIDKRFADTYLEWSVDGGRADYQKNRGQLKEVLDALEAGKDLTGPVTGRVPDTIRSFTNPESIAARNAVEEVVQRNLRLVLGAQFTQDEGERLIARAFNPTLDEAENAKRVRRLLTQMDRAASAKDAAAKYYEENGTLAGFGGTVPTLADFEAAASGDDAAPGGVSGPPSGDIGDGPIITDEDIAVTQRVQSAWDRGASLGEIDALLREAGKDPLSSMEGIDELLRLRDEGSPVQWTPSPSGERGALNDAASAMRDVIGDSGAAYAVGAANALTAGTLDEMAGGNSQNAQAVKDRLRETNPIASFAGEVTGGALAMVPAARAAQMAGRGALAGEVAYGAAYGAGESNENRAAGALGGAAGAYVGNKIGGAIVERFRGGGSGGATNTAAEALTPAQKVERAKQYGIDLSIGDARGRGAKAVERGLDSQLGSAGVMEQARDRTREQVTGALDDVASTFGGAGSDELTGEALQRGARRWIARAKGEKGNPLDRGVVGKAYDAIPIGKDSPASVNNTVTALEEINAQFSSNPQLAALMKDTKAQRMLDALGDAGGGLSWSDLKALRSAIGEDMGPMRIGAQDSRQSTLSRLYGALSEDMRETARLRGDKALRAFERANTLNRNVEERIQGALSTILGRDGMQSPERAASKLRNMITSGKAGTDIKTLAEIRKSMPAAEWSEVASGLIRLAGQPAKSEGREFAPAIFARTFKDMTPAAKNLLFGKADNPLRKNLDEFVKVMDDIAASDGTRNTSNTALAQGMTLSGLGGGATGFMVGGPLGAIAGPAATQFGAHALARMWTNPGFVRWATGFARMQRGAQKAGVQPSQANIEKQIDLLEKVAKGQGPISADIILFRDYLRTAAAQSPERLAAEPTGAALPSGDTRQSENTTTAQVPR